MRITNIWDNFLAITVCQLAITNYTFFCSYGKHLFHEMVRSAIWGKSLVCIPFTPVIFQGDGTVKDQAFRTAVFIQNKITFSQKLKMFLLTGF